jgi:hypothetical protein
MRLLREIDDWEKDWPRPVRPELQWRVGRSAVELAKAFFRSGTPCVPDVIYEVFQATPSLAQIQFLEGLPELTTSLPPEGTSGPRHHDLWLRGCAGNQLVGVGLEAKVDEPFGDPISHKYRTAMSAREAGKSTDRPERYEAVASLVLRRSVPANELRHCLLRYQLMSGVAGTLIQASLERRPMAAFLVYELITESSDKGRQELNQTISKSSSNRSPRSARAQPDSSGRFTIPPDLVFRIRLSSGSARCPNAWISNTSPHRLISIVWRNELIHETNSITIVPIISRHAWPWRSRTSRATAGASRFRFPVDRAFPFASKRRPTDHDGSRLH